jgi:PPOX class probable FMN-dependent enzyme
MTDTLADVSPDHRITTVEQLEETYGEASPRSLTKEIDYISDHYRVFIEKAPFVAVATSGPEGLDCSPRGDPPGFVRVLDSKTVLIPDRRGNNRIDTLRNIVQDPRVSLLFLIPGVPETMRINGRAEIITDPELLESFIMQGKLPRSILAVTVDRIYFQCSKALVRSGLWSADAQVERTELPSTGEMIAALSSDGFDSEEYDKTYPEHIKQTIY